MEVALLKSGEVAVRGKRKGPDRKIGQLDEILFGEPLASLVRRLVYVQQLERAWHVIENQYSNPELTLEVAAKQSGVSKNHLNALLRGVTSLTFHQILTRYRVLMATSMMMSKNYSILDLALENGFGSLNAFERNFRILMGLRPVEFRASCRDLLRARATLASITEPGATDV